MTLFRRCDAPLLTHVCTSRLLCAGDDSDTIAKKWSGAISNRQIEAYMLAATEDKEYTTNTFKKWLQSLCKSKDMVIYEKLEESFPKLFDDDFVEDDPRLADKLVSWLRTTFGTILTVDDFFLFIAQMVAGEVSGNNVLVHPAVVTGNDPIVRVPRKVLDKAGFPFNGGILEDDSDDIELHLSELVLSVIADNNQDKYLAKSLESLQKLLEKLA